MARAAYLTARKTLLGGEWFISTLMSPIPQHGNMVDGKLTQENSFPSSS